MADERVEEVWRILSEVYFLRHRSDEIVWHTEWLADSDTESEVGLLDVRRQTRGDGVEAVMYTPRTHHTFAHATAVLDELGMTIMDARIMPTENGYSLDTFIFMELDKRIEVDESRLNKIRRSLTRVLTAKDDNFVKVTRTAPRQVRMFTTKTSVGFGFNRAYGNTVMELITADRPGLLSKIGQVFMEQDVDIAAAKIMTIGERAEDVFYISDTQGRPLDEDAQSRLRERIVAKLDE